MQEHLTGMVLVVARPLDATELFAAPLIAQLQGCAGPDRAPLQAVLDRDWASSPDVEDWIPSR
jgi:hypothetical protein